MVNVKLLAFGIVMIYFFSLIPVQAQENCSEFWICMDWSFCMGSGIQMRTCKDVNRCGTENNKPPETQNCTPIAVREIVLPEDNSSGGGVTGLLISNAATVLAAVILGLGAAVYLLYRKWKDIKMFVSSP